MRLVDLPVTVANGVATVAVPDEPATCFRRVRTC